MAWTYVYLKAARMTELAATRLRMLEEQHYVTKLSLKAARDTTYDTPEEKAAAVDPIKDRVAALEAEMITAKAIIDGGSIDGSP
jgi:hypothetical protein